MRELLMKLLVEHGDREFEWEKFKGWLELHERGYLENIPRNNIVTYKITPAGLEYLKQENK